MPEQPILKDIRILDFSWVLAGPYATRLLADFGAEVIKVQPLAPEAADKFSRGYYNAWNRNKLGITLNLGKPEGIEIAKALVKLTDAVVENFSPRVMENWGLGYPQLEQLKPDIIMLSSSAYGQTGPMAGEWGVDGTGLAMSGYLDQTGWPDRTPVGANAPFGDVVLPYINAMAIVAALDYKRRTGKGQYIDTSMVEVCIHSNTPNLLDYQANNHFRARNGNRIDYASPHGAFPCKGEDRWCTIAVFNENEWQAFCRVIGNPVWTEDVKFADMKSRKKNEDELENSISQWTVQYTDYEVMRKMQAAGVPAGVVQTMADILDSDPQLRERDFLLPIKNPELGIFGHPAPAYKLTKTGARVRHAPSMGEHTEYICINILGLSDEEFAELVGQNVLE